MTEKQKKEHLEAMVKDLHEVINKHKNNLDLKGMSLKIHEVDKPAPVNITAVTSSPPNPGPCPPGKVPQQVTITLANGTLATEIVCV